METARKKISYVLVATLIALIGAFAYGAYLDSQKEPEPIFAQVDEGAPDLPAATETDPAVDQPADNGIVATDLLGLTSLSPFSISSATAELSAEKEQAIRDAINRMEEYGTCAFIVMNLDDGTGVVYNADAKVYAASSAKITLVFYALLQEGELPDDMKIAVENSIIYSDNYSYDYLAQMFYTPEYIAWLAGYGIFHDIDDIDGPYPDASPKSMAAIWTDVATYLDTDDEEARWLRSLLASTETSFVRDPLVIHGATEVLDKAGWIAESIDDEFHWYDGHLDATNDCGIVTIGDHRYVFAIMTGAPYSEPSALAVGELAAALVS